MPPRGMAARASGILFPKITWTLRKDSPGRPAAPSPLTGCYKGQKKWNFLGSLQVQADCPQDFAGTGLRGGQTHARMRPREGQEGQALDSRQPQRHQGSLPSSSRFSEHLSFLLTTDLRMLTRGLGMGLEGLFSKLSGSVEECPPFLACSASW